LAFRPQWYDAEKPSRSWGGGIRGWSALRIILTFTFGVYLLQMLVFLAGGRSHEAHNALIDLFGLRAWNREITPTGVEVTGLNLLFPMQLVTYMLFHSLGDLFHIGFNMLFVWILGRDLEAAMGREVRGTITTDGLPDPAPVPDVATLRSRLRDVNPQLRALDGAVRGATAASELASRGRWPQLSVGVDWIGIGEPDGISPEDAGRDAWMAMAMVELPLFFGARDGAHDEARATRVAREAERADGLLALTAALEAAVAGARELERRVVLYEETLLPRAEEAVTATTDAFTAGGASLTDVVDVHRVRLDLLLDLARARADLLVRRAEIASLAGPGPRALNEEDSR